MASEAKPSATTTTAPRRIGLLFVHGIGQQARWEHLHSSASRLAQLLKDHPRRSASVSVIDRTQGWSAPAGKPEISPPSRAPMTIQYRTADASEAIDFECHEVWWADLGKRSGFVAAFKFWGWGLGQWAAPIYASRDASKLDEAPSTDNRPEVHLPVSVGKQPGTQIATRLSLPWAGIAVSMIVLTLSLVLRLLSFLTGTKASVDLIVDYLGDVEVFQQRGRPGEGAVTDPGLPKRVAIRRRMITEMVAMGARDYDSWTILAHSLGSVVAFNGIGEIGHALPNYCDQELWDALPPELKRSADCKKRDDTQNMMPARPAWLEHEDCINKARLFGRLTNFITYGSPLGTFAAIWPRIVAFEKGVVKKGVFANTKWMNIVSGNDPVSGLLDRYYRWVQDDAKADLPQAFDLGRPTKAFYGFSHIAYFASQTREALVARTGGRWGVLFAPSRYAQFYDDVMAQLTRPVSHQRKPGSPRADPKEHDRQRAWSSAWVTAAVFLLGFTIVGLPFWLLRVSPWVGFSFSSALSDDAPPTFVNAVFGWGLTALSLVMLVVYALGLFRKGKEIKTDLAPIDFDIWRLKNARPVDEAAIAVLERERRSGRQSLWINRIVGLVSLGLLLVAAAYVLDWRVFHIPPYPAAYDAAQWLRPFVVPFTLSALFVTACAVQAFLSARHARKLHEVTQNTKNR